MNKGDILLIFENAIEKSTPYLVYDKNIAIGATLTGVVLLNLNTLPDNIGYKTVSLSDDIGWQKKKRLNDFLTSLITRNVTPTLKERVHFLKYILWIYEHTLGIKILENPIPITISNILESRQTFLH